MNQLSSWAKWNCALLFFVGYAALRDATDIATSAPSVPNVLVSQPFSGEVADYEDFTGQTKAGRVVELRARVSGYLEKIFFRAGTSINQGDRLFQIDSRLHQAELAKAEANVRVLKARMKCSQIELEKARMLLAKGSITQADVDLATEGHSVIEAELQAARADENIARIKLSHTQVVAPISGKIGSAFVDVGNTVRAEETPLAQLVSVAPMFVEFRIDERTLLKLRRQAQAGRFNERSHPVKIGFGGEGGFRACGALVFSDNQVDPTTGTLLMQAEFPNSEGLFLPGMFARIRLQVSEPYRALLISEQCLRDDKTRKYVLVVNEKNVVERRDIKVGLLYDGARAVKEGLSPADRVVLSGQDDLRPGMTVKPRPGPMSANGPKVDP